MISPLLEQKIQALVESFGYALYDLAWIKENQNHILRVCIYAPSTKTITLDACQEVSLSLSPLLDVELPDAPSYALEVSSPGIERLLKNPIHYAMAIGECVKIQTIDKKRHQGILKEVKEERLLVGEEWIGFDEIKKAQTFFDG